MPARRDDALRGPDPPSRHGLLPKRRSTPRTSSACQPRAGLVCLLHEIHHLIVRKIAQTLGMSRKDVLRWLKKVWRHAGTKKSAG
jgi:transposase-like protein